MSTSKPGFTACPFCGGPACDVYREKSTGLFSSERVWTICCLDCEAEGPKRQTREGAIRGWSKLVPRVALNENELMLKLNSFSTGSLK